MKKLVFLVLTVSLLAGCSYNGKKSDERVDVVNGIEYVDKYFEKIDVVIPKITSTNEGVLKLNEKMAEEIISRTYIFTEALSGWPENCEGVSTRYDYIIKNDIVAIYVELNEDGNCEIPSCRAAIYRYNYFYDIKNDKELSIIEALPLLGHTLEDLKEFNFSSFSELRSDRSYYIIESGKGTIYYDEYYDFCPIN